MSNANIGNVYKKRKGLPLKINPNTKKPTNQTNEKNCTKVLHFVQKST